MGASEHPGRSSAERDEAFRVELVALIPHLRAFARTLCGDATAADDLAQDAMLKAWDARESFQMGTNMKAWTFMILRNQFYSDKRRAWRQTQLDQEAAERTLVAVDDPAGPVALDELRQALAMLPAEQREALILVGASGFAYKEAAAICDCAVGTIKSRVARARNALFQLMNELNESGESEAQQIDDADAIETNGDGAGAEQNIVAPAQMNNAVLYARRLMGASRRILH